MSYTLSTLIAFLSFYIVSSNNSTICHPVEQCPEGTALSVERMSYELNTGSWNSRDNSVCPRSDPAIPQWVVVFQTSTDYPLTHGSFCTRTEYQFNASDACTMSTGEMVFHNSPQSSFQGSEGTIDLEFTSLNESYQTNLTIRYTTTGVYLDKSTVPINPSLDYVALSWYIYHPDKRPTDDVKLYYDNQLILDSSVPLDKNKYSVYIDANNKCVMTASGDTTVYYTLFVLNPSESSTGKYSLVYDTFSATITLEPAPYTPSQPSPIISSSHTMQSNLLTSTATESPPFSSIIQQSTAIVVSPSSTIIMPTLTSTPTTNTVILMGSITGGIGLIAIIVIVTLSVITIVLCVKHRGHNDNSHPSSDIELNIPPPPTAPDHDVANPVYLPQFSQDPSLNKYHLPNNGPGQPVINQEEPHNRATPSPVETTDHAQSTTHSTLPPSQSQASPAGEAPPPYSSPSPSHPRIAQLQQRTPSLSLPSSPRLSTSQQHHQSPSPQSTPLSQSSTQIHLLKEQNHLLKELYTKAQEGNELKKKIYDSTREMRDQSLEALDITRDISKVLENNGIVDTGDEPPSDCAGSLSNSDSAGACSLGDSSYIHVGNAAAFESTEPDIADVSSLEDENNSSSTELIHNR